MKNNYSITGFILMFLVQNQLHSMSPGIHNSKNGINSHKAKIGLLSIIGFSKQPLPVITETKKMRRTFSGDCLFPLSPSPVQQSSSPVQQSSSPKSPTSPKKFSSVPLSPKKYLQPWQKYQTNTGGCVCFYRYDGYYNSQNDGYYP